MSIPAEFLLAACGDGSRLTLVNRQSRPVQVRTSGDVSRAKMMRADDGAAAVVLRAAFPGGQVLMPGDSAQWSFGAGAGLLEVSPDRGDAVTSTLAASLPGTQDRVSSTIAAAAFGALVRSGVSAMDSHTACLAAGPNFLGGAACDLAAATEIGLALHTGFPTAVAMQLAGVMLDPAQWAAWSAAAAAADHAVTGEQVLRIGVQPPNASPSASSPVTRAVSGRKSATGPANHPATHSAAHLAMPSPVTPRPLAKPPVQPEPKPVPKPAPKPVPKPAHTDWPPQWPVAWPVTWPVTWRLPLPHPPSGGHDEGHDHDSSHDGGHDRGHGHVDPPRR